MSAAAPSLRADLEAGLRRLKLATFRRTAPELFQDAKAQRWSPEELLGALVEAEVAARDASMAAARLRAAGSPVKKTLDDLDLSASSIPRPTLDYLAILEWVRAKETPCLVGPPGTGKSHVLIALGHLAVEAGYKVRYFSAAELVEWLYRGLADNSVSAGASAAGSSPPPGPEASTAERTPTEPTRWAMAASPTRPRVAAAHSLAASRSHAWRIGRKSRRLRPGRPKRRRSQTSFVRSASGSA